VPTNIDHAVFAHYVLIEASIGNGDCKYVFAFVTVIRGQLWPTLAPHRWPVLVGLVGHRKLHFIVGLIAVICDEGCPLGRRVLVN
jgi:hypothetical protein